VLASVLSMRARLAILWLSIAGLALGCGGKVQANEQQTPLLDAGLEAEAGPLSCAGEMCAAGEICKYETESLDATPCCGTCVEHDAAVPDVWTCNEAEDYCRIACLAAQWPYVWCTIE
jgi:hypothetical protein